MDHVVSSSYVLILTNPEDYHAFVISEALERKGIPHGLWHAVDFPSLQRASVRLGVEHEIYSINGPEFSLPPKTRPSAVWLRRPGKPVVPEGIDARDQLFAYRECWAFLEGVRRAVGDGAFWVNPPAGFSRANLKIEQLRSAARSGFRIPETLVSNDPAEIIPFVKARAGRVVYKAFFPFSWQSPEGGAATLFSSAVSIEDLPEDPVLAAVPGIYQDLVDKAYEIRATVFGERFFAVKVHSQKIPSAHMDWRAATDRVPLEVLALPDSLKRACRAVMDDLGIVFGCFDLVVTPNDDYIFLEVNEMGAFLCPPVA